MKFRAPKNVDDYNQCVRQGKKDGIWYIYCVECWDWEAVAIDTSARRILFADKGALTTDHQFEAFVCSRCYADIGYLLNRRSREYILHGFGLLKRRGFFEAFEHCPEDRAPTQGEL